MSKNLVIVESPAKAKTIERYLGSDYSVLSSFGHIRDLPKKKLSIDKGDDFKPTYEISPDKLKVVKDLKAAVKKAGTVWLATDEDREGEAIAWHLCVALGLDPKKTKRIVFHEITKPAIDSAIAKPRTIDINLVDAQQARRVLDRLVGYELSPVLWQKVRTGLSAGRVQSVAVRIIVERERQIAAFKPDVSYKISTVFIKDSYNFPAELNRKPLTAKDAKQFLESIKSATYKVANIEQKPGSRAPSAPFTTSTLQQDAARRLGFSVRQTMSVAQKLYEAGQITYMRTDSVVISGLALDAAKKYIVNNYGQNYHHLRNFRTKSLGAQEAHEAIRPTDFNKTNAGSDNAAKKLYQLIWQRALASQMSAANIERTDVTVAISGHTEVFIAHGEILAFDGFLKVYGGGKEDIILPKLSIGDQLKNKVVTAETTYSRGPARYSEASLVKALEEMGIGRPSTYAPTISTIQARGYIEKRDLEGTEREIHTITLSNGVISEANQKVITGADKNKLLPTPIAEITTDFLVKYFGPIVDFDFTRTQEEEFDLVEAGKTTWNKMIKQFYNQDFAPLIKASAKATREETSQSRAIGKDPKSGKPITVRYGRFGPMLQKGEASDDAKPAFAPLPENTTMDNVSLTQALKMFELPRTVGSTDGGDAITANIGRFGPYVQVGKLYVSLKEHDPFSVNEKDARLLIKNKQIEVKKRNIADFGKLKILLGPYGPYITDGKKNAKISKEIDPKKLNEAKTQKLFNEAPAKNSFRKNFRKGKN